MSPTRPTTAARESPSTPGRIATVRDGHIATVMLAGPDGKPVMDAAFFAELAALISDLDRDPEVRALVLTGADRDFSYGLDLSAAGATFSDLMSSPDVASRLGLLELIRDWQRAMTVVAGCRTPTVAAIDGWCVGGGVDLAAACDVRIATRRATFSVREARMAIVADLGSLQRLVGVIGDGHLRELALTGDDISAERALAIGLVNHLYGDGEALRVAADELAGRLAAMSPLVLRGIKDVLDAARAPQVEAGLRYTALWNSAFLLSDDLREAMTAYIERRPPSFLGS